ncbi:hypothetical protein LTR36_001472 [Oleoguttula mirabilis]|uniref:WGR domain-containing protein n=1 Tax=Oleoguttula mirabilis TaxID=1507867 RepID=A0AAV9JNX8_9PEZI|nr:hypothetical protein LTR36_001472 [Oleoguttula mirabilis]
MGNHLKKTVITILYPIPELNKTWTREKLEGWIKTASGRHEVRFIEGETTHLVCSEKMWQAQPVAIQAALAANAKVGGSSNKGGVWIVTPKWLITAIGDQCKPHPGKDSWETLDREAMKQSQQAGKSAEKAAAKEVRGAARTVAGMLTETLIESTEKFISDDDRREMEKELKKRKEEAMREVQEKEKEKKREREQAALFRKGAKKAKNEVFSDNHHIYMDAAGFKYEVLLTKVDTKHNRNERHALTLQIYESNSEPNTYAFNLHFAGTGQLPSNNVLAAIGCGFETAFRAFKKCFREKTGINWDERIAVAVARAKQHQQQSTATGTGTGTGSPRGRPVSEASLERGLLRATAEEVVLEFGQRPFVYHPPLYGPRGLLPEKQREVFPEIGPPLREVGQEAQREDEEIELWMSGANGLGPSPNTNAVGVAEMQAGEGMDFVTGATPVAGEAHGAAERGEMDDFDQFMNEAEAASLAANGGHDDTYDFETSYPFGNQHDEAFIDLGLGHDRDQSMPVGYGQDSGGNEHEIQQETLGHTQVAEHARVQLDEFMGDVPAPEESFSGGSYALEGVERRAGGATPRDAAAEETGTTPCDAAEETGAAFESTASGQIEREMLAGNAMEG